MVIGAVDIYSSFLNDIRRSSRFSLMNQDIPRFQMDSICFVRLLEAKVAEVSGKE